MCLLVYKQPNVAMPLAHAVRGGTANSDGFGIAWHDGRQWQVHRTMDLLEHCRMLPDVTEYPALVHYRMATHGAVNTDNCHPFLVGAPDDPHAFVVAHNGMFSGLPREQARSDTRIMVDHVFSWLRPGWHEDDILLQQLQQVLGSWNKVAVLFADGTRLLFGESAGYWESSSDGSLKQGVWYSNTSYRDYRNYGNLGTYGTSGRTTTTPALPSGNTSVTSSLPPVLTVDALDDDDDDDAPAVLHDAVVVGYANFFTQQVVSAYCVECWDERGGALHSDYYDDITSKDVATSQTFARYTCDECGKTMNDVRKQLADRAQALRRDMAKHSARHVEEYYG